MVLLTYYICGMGVWWRYGYGIQVLRGGTYGVRAIKICQVQPMHLHLPRMVMILSCWLNRLPYHIGDPGLLVRCHCIMFQCFPYIIPFYHRKYTNNPPNIHISPRESHEQSVHTYTLCFYIKIWLCDE